MACEPVPCTHYSTHCCDTMEDEESEGKTMLRKEGEKSYSELKRKRAKYEQERCVPILCKQVTHINAHHA